MARLACWKTGFISRIGSGFVSVGRIDAWDCERFACLIHLKVSFHELPPSGQSSLLVGQSRAPGGWHLVHHDGAIMLQMDGGPTAISMKWTPRPREVYGISVFSVQRYVYLGINNRLVARANWNPMQRLRRGFTFGGRDGQFPIPFHGRMQNIRLAVGPLQ